MKIIGIVCAGLDGSIGKDNDLIWKSRIDMKIVKQTTTGHCIFMGRKTFESLPKGRLPGRLNIVLTKYAHHHESIDGELYFVRTIEEAITIARYHNKEKMFIFGGAQLYKTMFDRGLMREIQMTRVLATNDSADTYLDSKLLNPMFIKEMNKIDEWKEKSLTWQLLHLVYT